MKGWFSKAMGTRKMPRQSTPETEIAAPEVPPDELDPSVMLDELEERLLLCQYEQSDYERLRDKLLRGLSRLRLSLPVCQGSLDATRTDLTGTKYLYVRDDRRTHYAHGGFGGGFYVAEDPICQGAFFDFLRDTDYNFPLEIAQWLKSERPPESPMTYTTWLDARAYCLWLSASTTEFYDLPFEEEWKIAGETLKDHWPHGKKGWHEKGGKRIEANKWLPPGTEEMGSLLHGELDAPGHTGLLWEWCDDWVPSGGDSHVICSGVWPDSSTDGTYGRSRVLDHAWPAHRRIGTAGFRTVYLPQDCLRSSHRGILGVTGHSCPVSRYLADVVNDPTLPGSAELADARPSFYDSLPPDVRERVETVLSMVYKVERLLDRLTPGHPKHLDDASLGIPATPIGPGGSLNVVQVHPLADRRAEAPFNPTDLDQTRLRVAREIIATSEKHGENHPGYQSAYAPPEPEAEGMNPGSATTSNPRSPTGALTLLALWLGLFAVTMFMLWQQYVPWLRGTLLASWP